MTLTARRLFVAILFVALFVMAAREVTDPDFFWHLRTGQFITETHSIPHADVFSYTNAGKAWITHEWLSEVILFFLYQMGSFPALILTFSFLIALTFAFVYLRSPGRPFLAGLSVLLAALASAPAWGVRPQILSLLMASIFLFVLDKVKEAHRGKLLWTLPLLMVLWVNLHAGFALGIALIALYLFGELLEDSIRSRRLLLTGPLTRPLAITLALCVLVVPLNPNGVAMYGYPFETLGSSSMQTYIQEWFSPDFHLVQFQPFAWLMLATLGAISLSGKRTGITQSLLLLSFGYASLVSARQIPIFALVAAPVLSDQLTELVRKSNFVSAKEDRAISRPAQVLNWGLLGVILLAGVARVAMVVGNQQAAEEAKFPTAALEYIQSNAGALPMFNSYGWGGYSIWKMYPVQRVFIDGRADVYGGSFIEEYLKVWKGEAGWRSTLDRYGVNLVLIEPDAPLASRLSQDSGWNTVFRDNLAQVYQRK